MNPFIKLCNWYFSKKALPYWCVLAMDCLIVLFAHLISIFFTKGGEFIYNHFEHIILIISAYLIPYIIGFRLLHTYTGILRYSSFRDLIRIAFAMLIGATICIAINRIILDHFDFLHPSYNTIWLVAFLGTLIMWFSRISIKFLFEIFRSGKHSIRVFIFGTRHGGVSLAKSINSDIDRQYIVKGFVTPDKDMQKHSLMGLPIYNNDENVIDIMKDKGVTCLMVSPLQSDFFRSQEKLINNLLKADIQIRMMNQSEEWDGHSDLKHQSLHEIDIEDLLPRDKIEVNLEATSKLLKDKRILITGAAGSIGSEIVRQIATFKPAEMILIDQAETPMHDIRLMMKKYQEITSQTIVTSITNQTHMESIFACHKPDYVFHAAAYKHVPMMEDNPALAVQNNIRGTRVIADLAVKYGTKKFVMISTDKAVNPTNVMGCSKRICEIYCQSLNKAIFDQKNSSSPATILQADGSPAITQFVTTRFGNVLGSNGSVIPIFKEQISKGGPITVTHPDIIRFFMLIPEACRLVLEAGTMGKGGEIYIFDMGKPVKILDLAKRMISLSHAKNIEIKFTGLRDGEKLYEEVLNEKEITKPTHHPKIKIAAVREYDYETAKANEDRLLEASYTYDDMQIVKIMKEIVPEYKSQHSKYEFLDKQ